MNQKHATKVLTASTAFHESMDQHDWPGNVRELRNIVERAVIIAGEGVLEPRHVSFPFKRPAGDSFVPAVDQKQVTANAPKPIVVTPNPPRPPSGVGVDIGMTIDEAERLLIQATLLHAGNNKTKAASILGISTKTLHVKLRQYRIEESEQEAVENA